MTVGLVHLLGLRLDHVTLVDTGNWQEISEYVPEILIWIMDVAQKKLWCLSGNNLTGTIYSNGCRTKETLVSGNLTETSAYLLYWKY